MSMYDDNAMILFACQKAMADAQPVILGLVPKWHARPDTGMDEQIVAVTVVDGQCCKKGHLLCWNVRAPVVAWRTGGDAPAIECSLTANMHPVGCRSTVS